MSDPVRYIRELFDIPALVHNLAARRDLIRSFTWRQFSATYRGSFAGLSWSILQPVLMLAVYTLVFSLFLRVRFSPETGPFAFAVYLWCGLTSFTAIRSGIEPAATIVRSNPNLVKRVVFPLEILPVSLALTAAIHQVIGLILLIPLVWATTGRLSWAMLFIPVVMAAQFLLTTGLGWITASLGAHIPDMGHAMGTFMTIWMFLTPIFYPESLLPPWAAVLMRFNPMARYVDYYRKAVMEGGLPAFPDFLAAFSISFLVFLAGYFWFMKTKKGFADVL